LIAPAGYGKSVVLRQYLAELGEPHVRFALRGERVTLLSFVRGLAEAIRPHAAHAITALAGAYERATASSKRSIELARWMQAHLESFNGVIAIDDLHLADGDAEVPHFLSSLIERTKGRIRWILASRSTTGLPVGTWLAYRDADLPIDEEDLRFTFDEVRAAANALEASIGDEELRDLLSLTEGWPAAISFALRSSTRSSDLRNISAVTRELIYRYLAEQVYSALNDDERALLEVAIALPAIDVAVLENAGFDRALTIVERLRERTAFIYEESSGVYQCHDLFREFLRHQSALGGKQWHRVVHERAARALEASGDIEHAIAAYGVASSSSDVVRLIEHHGFDLLERARGDIIARAIEGLDESTRRNNATVLALQGALQGIAGKFARAEALFRRALSRAGGNRDLVATTSLRLASLIANQGGEVFQLLRSVGDDESHSIANRCEALSLMAAKQAVDKDLEGTRAVLQRLEPLINEIESDDVRAKVLHRMGIAFHHLGRAKRAAEVLNQAADLASESHLYSLESKANAVRSNLALHEYDDVDKQLRYAELAAAAGMKAGDAFALQTALLQILSAQMRRGDSEASIGTEQRLTAITKDELASRYVSLFRSVRLAWEGRFAEAHQLVGSVWDKVTFDFDRVVAGSEYVLFLALDKHHEASSALIRDILKEINDCSVSGLFRVRALATAKALIALAEAANGRIARAGRLLRTVSNDEDAYIVEMIKTIEGILLRLQHRADSGSEVVRNGIKNMAALGYAEVARLLDAADRALTVEEIHGDGRAQLTKSELSVLGFLAKGLVPKEIAEQSGRSVYTVRVHIANAIAKLGCHGSAEAIRKAQSRQLI
jgi:ATP/maltotriose-dependent transcriptional regulator MalT